MDGFWVIYALSVGVVVLAEMGDKTQLLAMAFATKYKASKVLLGVFFATILNHALAVLAGNLIAQIESIQVLIQCIASLSFIFFGLWTIRGDKLDGEENRKTRFGPVITVTIGFFIAEMADKTQLATIALATKYPESPIAVLAGTTTGMIIADAVGIVIGVVLAKKIPEQKIKLVSAAMFVIFGLIGSAQVMFNSMSLPLPLIILILLVLIAITLLIARMLLKKGGAH